MRKERSKIEGIIIVEDLKRSYGKKVAVDGISFKFGRGEIFGFLGPNGAGKSTTIKMLTGQLIPDSGNINVYGIDPINEEKKLSRIIGIVPESQNLYSNLNIEQNLNIFADLYSIHRKKVQDLIILFKLQEHTKKKIVELSKGLRQRVLIARALIHSPEILFLDEPTSGLDPNIAKEIRTVIKNLQSEGKTIFLTTHYMDEAEELCDRIAIINNGKIVALDSPHNLRLRYGNREIVVETEKEVKKYSFDELKKIVSINPDKLKTIHSLEPTLEDVFINLTGERFR